MRKEFNEELGTLADIARDRGAEIRPIKAPDIVVADWVRFKCRFGCKGYGKHMGCPPYTPDAAETRRMVSEYERGILVRFDGIPGHPDLLPDQIPMDFHPFFGDLIRWVNGTIHHLEKSAFYDGFYKAFGFGAYPCIYCEHTHCVAEEQTGIVDESVRRFCRHMDLVRPSMEAACMDVFATAKKVGWELETIPCKDMEYGKIIHGRVVSIGLVMIE